MADRGALVFAYVRPAARRWGIAADLVTSLLVVVLDNTILNIALPTIQRDLNADQGQLLWAVDAYILVFAALFERFGMFPALVALVLIASAGGDEFKLLEVIGNIVVLTVLCVLVFKVGLSMNISVISGVW